MSAAPARVVRSRRATGRRPVWPAGALARVGAVANAVLAATLVHAVVAVRVAGRHWAVIGAWPAMVLATAQAVALSLVPLAAAVELFAGAVRADGEAVRWGSLGVVLSVLAWTAAMVASVLPTV